MNWWIELGIGLKTDFSLTKINYQQKQQCPNLSAKHLNWRIQMLPNGFVIFETSFLRTI
tara:strand:- start:91642 stop:91818 length:177 start_codon:yes stop_codon:yes gene_type:complete